MSQGYGHWNPEVVRLLARGEVEAALGTDISGGDRLSRLVLGKDGSGDPLLATLTFGDLVYDCARVDPQVLEATDFARAEDLGNVFGFARFAEVHAQLSAEARDGSLNQLQGYVAERIVAQNLSASGYDVAFPENSNQEGWDLLVDGQPFQVKCVVSAQAAREHLERYPDIPVIVNARFGEELGEVDGVYIDANLSVEKVRELTESSLDHGLEIADLELPWIAATIAIAAEGRALLRGETALEASVMNVLFDAGGRVGGGSVGQVSGAWVGALLFGPAGAIVGGVAGAVGGAVLGGRAGRVARRVIARSQRERVLACSMELASASLRTLPAKTDAWEQKAAEIARVATSAKPNQATAARYVLTRMHGDIAYFGGKGDELRVFREVVRDYGDPKELARKVLVLIKRAGLHPHPVQAELRALLEAISALRIRERQLRV